LSAGQQQLLAPIVAEFVQHSSPPAVGERLLPQEDAQASFASASTIEATALETEFANKIYLLESEVQRLNALLHEERDASRVLKTALEDSSKTCHTLPSSHATAVDGADGKLRSDSHVSDVLAACDFLADLAAGSEVTAKVPPRPIALGLRSTPSAIPSTTVPIGTDVVDEAAPEELGAVRPQAGPLVSDAFAVAVGLHSTAVPLAPEDATEDESALVLVAQSGAGEDTACDTVAALDDEIHRELAAGPSARDLTSAAVARLRLMNDHGGAAVAERILAAMHGTSRERSDNAPVPLPVPRVKPARQAEMAASMESKEPTKLA